MSYEKMTYELILNRMKNWVAEQNPDLDTREGSIIFDALAPAALEQAIIYTELSNILAESFVDTASREGIYNKCKEIGLDTEVFEATYGIHRGRFNVEVPIGSRWNCDVYNYTVTKFISSTLTTGYDYELQCETRGVEPNDTVGYLTPITDYPDGLIRAELMECLILGEDDVSDEVVRQAYYSYVNSSSGDGNVAQYKTWCELYPGIGNYKVFPLWNGANTVKVSILNDNNDLASETLINNFQEYIDPGKTGMGDGVAPIGSIVTVSTATEKSISIVGSFTIKQGYTLNAIPINDTITEYFKEISYQKNIIPYFEIASRLLNIEGIESVLSLKINGDTVDITLGDEEIPKLGATSWTEG